MFTMRHNPLICTRNKKTKSPLQASYSMRQTSGVVAFIRIKLTFANYYSASVIKSIHVTEIGRGKAGKLGRRRKGTLDF